MWRLGFRTVVGVDEVGRGAWAGPLVAAAVVAPFAKKSWHKMVKDSKMITHNIRQIIFNLAQGNISWAIGVVENKEIDKIGVAAANHQAINLAVTNLKIKPDYVLVDYVARLGPFVSGSPSRTIVDGDAKVFSIALASVLAKVSRDQLMIKYDTKYPGYGFAQHKGYGTRQHLLSLQKLGPCPIHRRTYRPLRRVLL